MQKIGKGNYEQESFLQQFYRSCLGKAIILCAIIALLLTAAYFSVPDEKTMYAETVDNVRQSISANIESKEDEIDCVVNNFSAFFWNLHNPFFSSYHPLLSFYYILNKQKSQVASMTRPDF